MSKDKTEEITICDICDGQESVVYYNQEPKICIRCDGKGRIWKITEVFYEKIEELHPRRREYRGM